MNSPETHGIRRSLIVITLVFTLLAIAIQGLMLLYWSSVLEPRLRLESDSQAKVLAQSQASILANTLTSATGEQRIEGLTAAINQALLLADPDTGTPFFMGIGLDIDYDTLPAAVDSLNLQYGVTECIQCFSVDVALYSNLTDELLGIAWFKVSDRFFQLLSRDMKYQLFTETAITLLLMGVVWLLVMELFRRLHQAKQRIENASAARSRFLANVSHEIRTPLNAILGYTQIMQRDKNVMRTHHRAVDTIYNSGEHLLLMINDILDLSKIEAAKLELRPNDFRLPEFIYTLTEMMRLRAEVKNLEFTQTTPVDLPTTICGDEKRLRQILLNLLSNAVKFTPEGEVHFEVTKQSTREIDGKAMQTLRFLVKDTGIGIAAEKQSDIFVAFQQITNPEFESEGTGLGLSISQRLIRLMGGELHLESQPGQGSSFWFVLEFPIVQDAPLKNNGKKTTIRGYAGPRRNLLIVDDNAINCDLLSRMLTSIGFIVEQAENSFEALQKLSRNDFDLVLLDLFMPTTDGFKVAELIRQKMPDRHMPIIAISAAADDRIQKKVQSSGFQDFLGKPVNVDALYSCLQTHLGIEWLKETHEADHSVMPAALDNTPLALPSSEKLEQILSYAKTHNILELRQVSAQLKQQQMLVAFTNKLDPMINNYQFKMIVEWLESIISEEGEVDASR